ncbi:MAG: tripartite tricarboxylate transporter permease [Duodenibacillus sp.]|nr:tripartite tricarboxylate transporter permease [Duodenibacillus sp.]
MSLLSAFGTIFTPDIFLMLAFGVLLGLVVGATPGLNDTITLAVLVPISFSMPPTYAFALLVGVYCSACYGGSIPAILLKIPGTASSVVTTIDGYAMTQKGQAGLALGVSTISSVAGGIVSSLALMFFAPSLASYALRFGPPEYCMLAVLGLSTVAGMSGKEVLKNLIVCVLGLLISTIGTSPQTGYSRYTFDIASLYDGLPLVPMLIGLFGVSSIFHMLEKMGQSKAGEPVVIPEVGKTLPSGKLLLELVPVIALGSILGTFIGILPGALLPWQYPFQPIQMTLISAFTIGLPSFVLALEPNHDLVRGHYKKLPIVTGVPHGVAAPESANNSVVAGSMVPLLALGVPGNSTSALFLGALMIQGLRPGPSLFSDHPDIAYMIIVAFFVANIIMGPLGLMLGRAIAKVIFRIKQHLMAGVIILLCLTGCYSVGNSPEYVVVAIVFGVVGYLMDKTKLPQAPLVLALVLGPMMETGFEQSLSISGGSYMIFLTSPISCFMLVVAIFFCLIPVFSRLRARFFPAKKAA